MQNQITKTLFAPLNPVIDFPFYPRIPPISLELTARCNLRCPYCLNSTLTRPKETISWELLEKIVDEAAGGKLNIANLHGAGEPLLFDRLEDVVRLIRQRNAGLATFGTNGMLLTEQRFRSLLDAGLTQIYFSIDTLDPHLYQKTRGGSLDVVIQNVKSAIRLAPHDFQLVIALMNHKKHLLTKEIIDQFHTIFGDHPNVLLNPVENEFFPGAPEDYRVAPQKRYGCWAPLQHLFIAADGNVAICCMDQNVKHCLGNVRERSIQEIWFDQRHQTLFRNVALGAFDAPHVCTHDCVLHTPKTGQNIVALGFGLPFDETIRFAHLLALNQEIKAALEIAQQLLRRDPHHEGLQAFIAQLQPLFRRN